MEVLHRGQTWGGKTKPYLLPSKAGTQAPPEDLTWL